MWCHCNSCGGELETRFCVIVRRGDAPKVMCSSPCYFFPKNTPGAVSLLWPDRNLSCRGWLWRPVSSIQSLLYPYETDIVKHTTHGIMVVVVVHLLLQGSTYASSGTFWRPLQVYSVAVFNYSFTLTFTRITFTSNLPPLAHVHTPDHTGLVTGVRFGKNASFVASVGMDRSLKYFGLEAWIWRILTHTSFILISHAQY